MALFGSMLKKTDYPGIGIVTFSKGTSQGVTEGSGEQGRDNRQTNPLMDYGRV